jgi:hypothetical protein
MPTRVPIDKKPVKASCCRETGGDFEAVKACRILAWRALIRL